jgi:hypothetical protein
MAGATAAGLTASQASAVTISLVGNYISARDGNHLNADLTGDGHPDLTLTGASYKSASVIYTGGGYAFSSDIRTAAAFINGIFARGHRQNVSASLVLGSQITFPVADNSNTASLTGTIPIFFKDLHINSGVPTGGFLEVTVSVGSTAEVDLNSLTYNSNALAHASSLAAPDQGSSLALLAMGAGGVLALRRSRAALARS